MAASALLKSRIRRPSYLNKLAKAEDLIDLFPHNSYIGWSGFTGVGYPKFVPLEPHFTLSTNNPTERYPPPLPTTLRRMASKASSNTTFSLVPRAVPRPKTDGPATT